MSPVRSPYSTMLRPTATMRWARPVCFRSEGDIRLHGYRFNRRSGELVLPEGRMLVMRLDEEEMWVMDHDQYELEYPTVERFRRLK